MQAPSPSTLHAHATSMQGEESEVILLSLVRSNALGSIGFLGVDNRVCVALSRAKHGLYIIGNGGMLAARSPLWSKILGILSADGNVGGALPLVCHTHPSTITAVALPSDFDVLSHGGCSRSCSQTLPCGHPCGRRCHPYPHSAIKCMRPCGRTFRGCSHRCAKACHEPCGACPAPVAKPLPCGHTLEATCGTQPESVDCQELCARPLPCGHACGRACSAPCVQFCATMVEKELPCGHTLSAPCSKDAEGVICTILVDTPAIYTGPLLVMPCYESQRVVNRSRAR
jgi:hypothetical protein